MIILSKLNIDISKYDFFEIDPICGEAEELCEREQADYWSVFGHLKEGHRECLGDFETEKKAKEFADKLRIALNPKLEKIRKLNDEARTLFLSIESFLQSGRSSSVRVHLTPGITEFFPEDMADILRRVYEYDDFTDDNDPNGERDFGLFEYEGEKIFWKIDYYDRDLKGGSEDPSDPEQTTRVLTIMLASEY
jgi:hypothetical protein